MAQERPQPNRWLISYILHYQSSRSRYEIDRDLLSQGYPPAEIEIAWQLISSGQHRDLMITPYEAERQKRSAFTGCLKIGCSVFLILFVILVIQLIIYFNPSLPDPLPDYPGATKIPVTSSLPSDLINSYCYSLEAFDGEKFQTFVTSDNRSQVYAFYHKAALERGLNFEGTEQYLNSSKNYVNGATCFSHGTTSPMLSPHLPALAMRVFSRDNLDDAKIIAQYFPQAPSNTNVILLLQGFKRRTVA